jgi:hypothetical protein
MNPRQSISAHTIEHVTVPAVEEACPGRTGAQPGSDIADEAQRNRLAGLFGACKAACEYLQGARDDLPDSLAPLASPWLRGLWWGFLAGIILLFAGQTSKFIYIDF